MATQHIDARVLCVVPYTNGAVKTHGETTTMVNMQNLEVEIHGWMHG